MFKDYELLCRYGLVESLVRCRKGYKNIKLKFIGLDMTIKVGANGIDYRDNGFFPCIPCMYVHSISFCS